MAAQISFTFDAEQDRLWLVAQVAEQRSGCWLTRRVSLALLKAWVNKLEQVPLPHVAAPWMPPRADRQLAQEHALSLEFDAPRSEVKPKPSGNGGFLATVAQLTVSPTESQLVLKGQASQVSVLLTRRESHAFVEALALQARQAQWLTTCALPPWLGTEPEAVHKSDGTPNAL